jgi:hypothetical protein
MKGLFFVIFCFFMQATGYAEHTKYIELKNEKTGYAPRGFYISHVIDDREDKGPIGTMNGDELALGNGVASSVSNFIAGSVSQQKTAQPVDMHITLLNCKMKRRGSQWEITAEIETAFSIDGKALVEFAGRGNARTSSDPSEYLSSLISKAVINDMKQFEQWWVENKSNIALTASVKVNVTIARTTDKPGLFVYTLQRPLRYSDFKGPIENRAGNEAAATVSGIGLSYEGDIKNSQMVINITIFANFNTEQSWFRKSDEEPRVLAHEQAHFDITALYACRLANAFRTTNFTKENYLKLIEKMQQDNAVEVIKEEDTYDAETRHGILDDKQLIWQTRVREEVKKCGCF